jgi:transposase
VLALHSARSLSVKQQTMLANAMHGLATEFGLTVAKRRDELENLAMLVDADQAFPSRARHAFTESFVQCGALADSIATFAAQIAVHTRHDETARRLVTIPGIGPIMGSLIALTVVDIGVFKPKNGSWVIALAGRIGGLGWDEPEPERSDPSPYG